MTNVLVVDDSALVRQLMLGTLEGCGMTVQCAADPLFALERLRKWSPDVIVLDLEMPRMHGLTFLRVLAREHPGIPVVICSGVAGERSIAALRALQEGAVEVVARPRIGLQEFFRDGHVLIADAINAAVQTRKRPHPRWRRPTRPQPVHRTRPMPRVIALGASTGGTEALREIIAALPPDAPATVVVQHMPGGFTTAFAKWLDQQSSVRVKEAVTGDPVVSGTVLIAPGGYHLTVCSDAFGALTARVAEGALVSRHRPSVDVLFESVAKEVGASAAAAVLTGMGDDGKNGLLALHRTGAATYAQDEATSMVFGMPKAAIEAGAVDDVLPLPQIVPAILGQARAMKSAK